jgi:hypothetical protein
MHLMLKIVAGCVVAALPACETARTSTLSPQQAEKAAKSNEKDTYQSTKDELKLQLALEIEFTQGGISVVGSKIIRAPVKANSAMSDLVVQAKSGERVVGEYSVADPRLVEVEKEGGKVLPQARAFVYLPLTADLTELSIRPAQGREGAVSQGGVIALKPHMKEACEKRREIDVCQEILRSSG